MSLSTDLFELLNKSEIKFYFILANITNHNVHHGALQSVQHMTHSVLRPLIQVGKNSPKKHFNREKMKKAQEEHLRKDPPPRTDRQEIDVVCTE